MNPKETKRIKALLKAFDGGAVMPEELTQAIEAVVQIIRQNQDAFASKIVETEGSTKQSFSELNDKLTSALDRLDKQAQELSTVSKNDIANLKKEIVAEIKRVSSLIPTLPPEFDATELQKELGNHKNLLDNLSLLISGENIRNALEAINDEEEKLAISAIGNLRKELDALEKKVKQSSNKLDTYGGGVGAIKEMNGWTNGSITTYNKLTVSATEPVNPRAGDLWCDTA